MWGRAPQRFFFEPGETSSSESFHRALRDLSTLTNARKNAKKNAHTTYRRDQETGGSGTRGRSECAMGGWNKPHAAKLGIGAHAQPTCSTKPMPWELLRTTSFYLSADVLAKPNSRGKAIATKGRNANKSEATENRQGKLGLEAANSRAAVRREWPPQKSQERLFSTSLTKPFHRACEPPDRAMLASWLRRSRLQHNSRRTSCSRSRPEPVPVTLTD